MLGRQSDLQGKLKGLPLGEEKPQRRTLEIDCLLGIKKRPYNLTKAPEKMKGTMIINRSFLYDGEEENIVNNLSQQLHESFPTLSQEDQKYANQILFDIQNGTLILDKNDSHTFNDYINQYKAREKNDQIHKFASRIGYSEDILRSLVNERPTEANINVYGRFDALRNTLDADKAQEYFSSIEGKKIPKPLAKSKTENLARDFIIKGGYDLKKGKKQDICLANLWLCLFQITLLAVMHNGKLKIGNLLRIFKLEFLNHSWEQRELWELTTWDKKFNGVESYKQPKSIKYPYVLADVFNELEETSGDVRLLSTGTYVGYTTKEKAGNNLCYGEIVAIPWGGVANVKYYNGYFVSHHLK